MKHRVRVSAAEARRIALAAQGFDRRRPANANDARHFRRILRQLGLLQLDFVNVLVPAHYLVMWSRLGAYDRQRFDDYIYGNGTYTEQWAHEASIVPTDLWPVLAHRRTAWRPWKHIRDLGVDDPDSYLAAVLDRVREQGAITASDLPPVAGPKPRPGDWHRSVPRRALEYHFGRGDLAVTARQPNFQRIYDVPERVIPEQHLRRVMSREDADREFVRRAASSFGVATLQDLADYYRMVPRDAAPRIQELVETDELVPVEVEGWTTPAYVHAAARTPRTIEGASLLSPFDPVVWFRPRAERLFGFRYRIEIYVPERKRKYGYYVLPFRLGDRIVARVDLKADRAAEVLRVQHAHLEPFAGAAEVVEALAVELDGLRHWLGLERMAVSRHNTFSRQLGRSLCPNSPA